MFSQSNFKDVMESLAVARTEYEQKTHAVEVVRSNLLLNSYRNLSIVHVQDDGSPVDCYTLHVETLPVQSTSNAHQHTVTYQKTLNP